MKKSYCVVWISGSSSGLSLILNVEQYEYMRGPQNDAGVKVIIFLSSVLDIQE